jgi:hypothetical protein
MTSSTPSVQNVGPETEPVEVKLTQLAMQQHEVTDSAATAIHLKSVCTRVSSSHSYMQWLQHI